jgi:uncharacterized protein (TIGR01777 family)
VKIAVTGASGLIGSSLVPYLRRQGHDVVSLVRREPRAPSEARWDPTSGDVDLAALRGTDGVVHLAGAGVGDRRWTDEYKRTILNSRVDGTRTIAEAMAALDPRPTVLVSGSAIGFYGDRGDELLDEGSPGGSTFLSDVVRAWEGAADPARDAGIRVVHPRTGLVMARSGGAFGQLLPLLRLGLGGPLGSGRQWWSWITLRDEVRALVWLLEQQPLSGRVNLTAPAPARQRDVVAALARSLHRPAVLPAPAPALRLVLGQFASEVLASQRVVPKALQESGFTFEHPDLESAARWTTSE